MASICNSSVYLLLTKAPVKVKLAGFSKQLTDRLS